MGYHVYLRMSFSYPHRQGEELILISGENQSYNKEKKKPSTTKPNDQPTVLPCLTKTMHQ